jgi:hypothetical protein
MNAHELLARSRAAQGLPPEVEDDGVLDQLAHLLDAHAQPAQAPNETSGRGTPTTAARTSTPDPARSRSRRAEA